MKVMAMKMMMVMVTVIKTIMIQPKMIMTIIAARQREDRKIQNTPGKKITHVTVLIYRKITRKDKQTSLRTALLPCSTINSTAHLKLNEHSYCNAHTCLTTAMKFPVTMAALVFAFGSNENHHY